MWNEGKSPIGHHPSKAELLAQRQTVRQHKGMNEWVTSLICREAVMCCCALFREAESKRANHRRHSHKQKTSYQDHMKEILKREADAVRNSSNKCPLVALKHGSAIVMPLVAPESLKDIGA